MANVPRKSWVSEILARSRNLGNISIESQRLVFFLFGSEIAWVSGSDFQTRVSASRWVSDFTICHPYYDHDGDDDDDGDDDGDDDDNGDGNDDDNGHDDDHDHDGGGDDDDDDDNHINDNGDEDDNGSDDDYYYYDEEEEEDDNDNDNNDSLPVNWQHFGMCLLCHQWHWASIPALCAMQTGQAAKAEYWVTLIYVWTACECILYEEAYH